MKNIVKLSLIASLTSILLVNDVYAWESYMYHPACVSAPNREKTCEAKTTAANDLHDNYPLDIPKGEPRIEWVKSFCRENPGKGTYLEGLTQSYTHYSNGTVYQVGTQSYDPWGVFWCGFFEWLDTDADGRPDDLQACEEGTKKNHETGLCEESPLGYDPEQNAGDGCGDAGYAMMGNPVNAGTGNKFQSVVDDRFATGHLQLKRIYNSNLYSNGILQRYWTFTFERKLYHYDTSGTVKIQRPDGNFVYFNEVDGAWVPEVSDSGTLTRSPWTYTTPEGIVESYKSIGPLLKETYPNGYAITYTWDTVYPDISNWDNSSFKILSAQDSFGNRFDFTYDESGTLLDRVHSSSGLDIQYSIENKALQSVSYLSAGSEIGTVTYNYADIPGVKLSSIVDERDRTFASWSYDPTYSMAESSGHGAADENGNHKEQYRITGRTTDTATVTNPFGKETVYHFETINGTRKVVKVEGVASTNCAAANAFYSYDAQGNKDKVTDWALNVKDYDYSTSGLLEKITEGLRWADSAARTETVTTLETRSTEMDWIPDTRQIEEIRAPGLTTHYDYFSNAQIDKVTLTDTTAVANAFGSTNGQQRVTDYSITYHSGDELPENTVIDTLTVDGPLVGTSDQTQYQYDSQGRLQSITNALGHVQQFSDYNGRGLPETVIDANNIVTKFSYHPRGWLESVTVKDPSGNTSLDAVIQYQWYPNGTLEQVTLPDNSFLHYDYNDARHLTEIRNNLGEVITFEPNEVGEWEEARTKDVSATMRRLQSRAFDELGRLMDVFGNNDQHTHFDYDANGNVALTSEHGSDRVIATTMNYDSLNRLKDVIKPVQTDVDGTLSTVDVNTQYLYDSADNLIQVIDPNGNSTQYFYNGFGEKIRQISPDTGITDYWYDAQGNLTDQMDARNVHVQYHYDALGRLTWVQYPNSAEDIHYYYDEVSGQNPYATGRLTRVVDQSGSTHYVYDHRGNRIAESRTVDTQTYTTQYGFNVADNLTSIIYPNGRTVHYYRDDTLGRISSVTTQAASGAPELAVVNNIQYLPFGPALSFEYGNGLLRQVPYDLDYRVDTLTITGDVTPLSLDYDYDDFDNVQRIFDLTNSAHDQQFAYDDLHRLQHAYGSYANGIDHIRYEYDPVGNRTLRAKASGGVDALVETYTYLPGSNQLDSLIRTADGANSTRSFVYNDAGDLANETTLDGTNRSYSYNDNARLIELSEDSQSRGIYSHNAFGQRVQKITPQQTTHFIYNQSGQLLAEASDTGALIRTYIYLDGEMVALLDDGATTDPTPLESVFQQPDDGSGMIVMEAEHFQQKASDSATGEIDWQQINGAYSNGIAMQALPDIAVGGGIDSARMDYRIDFAQPGTYYVSIRGYGANGGSDTVLCGFNGVITSGCDAVKLRPYETLDWFSNQHYGGARVTIEVPSAGVHTFNLWMRETGAIIDKIILSPTSDRSTFVGTSGPAESPLADDVAVNDTNPPSVPGGFDVTYLNSNSVSLGWGAATDSEGVVAGYRLYRDGQLLATTSSLEYTDSDLAPSTPYTYSLLAFDNATPANESATTTVSVTTSSAESFALRVNAGGESFTDSTGNAWLADTGFNTGRVAADGSDIDILNTLDDTIYHSQRWDVASLPELAYNLNVPNGDYQVIFHYAETYSGNFAVGARIFDVLVEGQLVSNALDIFAQTGGGNTALTITSDIITVNDGEITLEFVHGAADNPSLAGFEILGQISETPSDTTPPTVPTNLVADNLTPTTLTLNWTASTDVDSDVAGYRIHRDGIEIATTIDTSYTDTGLAADTNYLYTVTAFDSALPSNESAAVSLNVQTPAETLEPIRINAGGGEYTDTQGQLWLADTGFNTGSVAVDGEGIDIANTQDDTLYHSQRWDRPAAPELEYSITVPNGIYNVVFHFAESYSGNFAIGARRFDVALEGAVVLTDVDIFAQSGGGNIALISSGNLINVTDGQLNIQFLHGAADNPSVAGIEIIPVDVTPVAQFGPPDPEANFKNEAQPLSTSVVVGEDA